MAGVDRPHKDISVIPKPLEIDENYWKHDPDYLRQLNTIQLYIKGELSQYVDLFLLHGSMADGNYRRGWSDVDTFVVVSASTMNDPDSLVDMRARCHEIREMIDKMAPLQHHGLMVVTDASLLDYPSTYLPTEVLMESLDMIGNAKEFNIHKRPFNSDALLRDLYNRENLAIESIKTGYFKHHSRNGKYLEIPFRNRRDNMYQLHYFLGYTMTLPALVLSGIGMPTRKSESFDKARCLFSSCAWELVEKATEIRNEWQEREYPGYTGNTIPDWVCETLRDDYMERFIALIRESIIALDNKKAYEA
ncbi:MAG: nucleotidyltransferase domain-containing protein [bacterium]